MKKNHFRAFRHGESILRRGRMAVAAWMAVASAATSWAQENTAAITGLDDLTGLTFKEIHDNRAENYNDLQGGPDYSTSDMTKVLFLYNVKTKQFVNAGGYWGTHVSLKNYPMMLWARKYCGLYGSTEKNSSTLNFAQELGTGVGPFVKWWVGSSSSADSADDGVFIDRSTSDAYGYPGWFFEATGDAKNTYRLYTYTTPTYSDSSEKMYLCANSGGTDQDKNCGAATAETIKDKGLEGYDEWRVFSMQQIYNVQSGNTDNLTSSLDLSFKLQCPGFARGVKAINNWKTYLYAATSEGAARFGLEYCHDIHHTAEDGKAHPIERSDGDQYSVMDETAIKSYSFAYGTAEGENKFSDLSDYKRHMGKYFCADVKEARGLIYQDVTVRHTGTYVIECKAYSTTPEAKLFACVSPSSNKEDIETATMRKTTLAQVGYMTGEERAALHTDEQNMDYAGKEFYGSRKYINSVIIEVPDDEKLRNADGTYTIRFGIMVGDYGSQEQPKAGEWTVFDDFRLLYASNAAYPDLILDESQPDLTYLTESTSAFKNRTLHLQKTLTKDKWDSLVLPVSLTLDQFRQTFGANARLAKLQKLTEHEILFQSVKPDETKTSETFLEAYTPYIIFNTRDLATDINPAHTSTYVYTGTGTASDTRKVIVAANHTDIANVTLPVDNDGLSDFSRMNTETWTVNLTPADNDGSITAWGTFARTFDPAATQDETTGRWTWSASKGQIIPGRDNLIGSYFFDRGAMYYSDLRPRGLRGFSCWFKPTKQSTTTEAAAVYIDGVRLDGGVASIGGAAADPAPTAAPEAVYNLQGQCVGTTHGTLPAGIYVAAGHKFIVK